MKKIIRLGEKVMVSDPCYGLNTWCQGVLENVLPGKYNCEVEYKDEGDWGIRVSAIEVTHEDYAYEMFESQDFEVGVDSGQAGIFDYDYYCQYHTDINDSEHVDDDWYDRVCDKTHEYISNPEYTLFVDTPEYKAGVLGYRIELDALVEKYPNLDVETAYMELINHYNSLSSKDKKVDLSSLVELLENINKLLEDKSDGDAILEKSQEVLEEIELHNIKHKHEMIMHKLWDVYMSSEVSQAKIFRFAGNTIDGLGLVSSSGYGDGGYTCYTSKNKDGKINAIRIEFIPDNEEWDDEE